MLHFSRVLLSNFSSPLDFELRADHEGDNMTSKRQVFIAKLIRTLVDEWGYDEVQKALTQLSDQDGRDHLAFAWREESQQRLTSNREASKSKRPTAVEQATKLSIPDGQRESLLAIAAKLDRKEFLPSVGDVREFLAMMGEDSEGMKDRSDGFRRLLRSLSLLPSDRLEHLASSSRYSGPAQLGPLSDAIRSTGEAIRRGESVPEREQNS